MWGILVAPQGFQHIPKVSPAARRDEVTPQGSGHPPQEELHFGHGCVSLPAAEGTSVMNDELPQMPQNDESGPQHEQLLVRAGASELFVHDRPVFRSLLHIQSPVTSSRLDVVFSSPTALLSQRQWIFI